MPGFDNGRPSTFTLLPAREGLSSVFVSGDARFLDRCRLSVSKAVLIASLLVLASCGGGSDDDAEANTSTSTASVTFPAQAQNVSLTAGVPREFVTVNTFDVRALGGPFESVTIDTSRALENLTAAVMRPVPAGEARVAARTGATVQIYTGLAEERDTLCTGAGAAGYQALSVILDGSNQPASVEPAQFVASPELVDIYNSGSVATCTRVTTTVDAVASMSGLEAEYQSCTQPPGDFNGSWSGTYSCGGSCPESGDITLTVTQNGAEAVYSDGDASYSGYICGDVFSYRGGNAGYDESGKLSLTGGNTATKSSFYRSFVGGCSGRCTDTLTRD